MNWLLNPRQQLLLSTVVLVVVMSVLVPLLTETLGPVPGFLACFGIYWLCFCLPVGWFFIRREYRGGIFGLRVGSYRRVPWAVTLQIAIIAVSSWMLASNEISALVVSGALLFGMLNGVFEEFAWRGAFLEHGRGDATFQVLGVGLFTAWHVPLTLAHGITYPGGNLSLVGGALAMGTFWAFLAAQTSRIGWPVISHVLTNSIAFVGFFSTNSM